MWSIKLYSLTYMYQQITWINQDDKETCTIMFVRRSLLRRHNERDGVSNHRRRDCLLHRLFRRRPKKLSKLRVTGLCKRNPPVDSPRIIYRWPPDSPDKDPVTQRMFPFDDDIMSWNVAWCQKRIASLAGFLDKLNSTQQYGSLGSTYLPAFHCVLRKASQLPKKPTKLHC